LRRLVSGLTPRRMRQNHSIGTVRGPALGGSSSVAAEPPPHPAALWPSRGAIPAFPVGEDG
jgi:hypothetical protein